MGAFIYPVLRTGQGMISNSEEGMQRLIDRLNEVAKSYKMRDKCEEDKNYDSV